MVRVLVKTAFLAAAGLVDGTTCGDLKRPIPQVAKRKCGGNKAQLRCQQWRLTFVRPQYGVANMVMIGDILPTRSTAADCLKALLTHKTQTLSVYGFVIGSIMSYTKKIALAEATAKRAQILGMDETADAMRLVAREIRNSLPRVKGNGLGLRQVKTRCLEKMR